MDRTSELAELTGARSIPSNNTVRKKQPSFRGLAQADELFRRICDMDNLLDRSKDQYVDYHRYLRPMSDAATMSSESIQQFESEVTMFLATCTTETQQLKKICGSNLQLNESYLKHCITIVNILLEVMHMPHTFSI